MRIALDLSAATQQGAGIARYALELARALTALDTPHEWLAFYNRQPGARLPAALSGMPERTVGLANRPWRLALLARHVLGLPWDDLVSGVDVFHGCDYLVPPLRRVPSVVTVHDLSFLLQPQYHTRFNRFYLRACVPYSVRAARAVIADSETTRGDLVRWLPDVERKTRVISLGVSTAYRPVDAPEMARVRARYGLPERYILFVGTLEPRKNLVTLLHAYHALRQEGADAALVVAGKKGWLYEEFMRQPESRGLLDGVTFAGYVPEADLPALYSGATVFAMPSWYEGFGLPVLEAMACGAPVACSNAASLAEVVGDAALLALPGEAGEIAAALRRVLADEALRLALRGKGLARAARFSWEATARRTLAVYEEVGLNRQNAKNQE